MESISSEIAYFPVDMRSIAIFRTIYNISVWNSYTMTEVSGVGHILSIKE